MKQSRQRTIGVNPLELYLSGAQAFVAESSQEELVAQTQEIIQELQPRTEQEVRLSPTIEILAAEPEVNQAQPAQEFVNKQEHVIPVMSTHATVEIPPVSPVVPMHEQTRNVEPVIQAVQAPVTIIEELHAQELKIEDSTHAKKQRVTIHIPEELIDKVKNAVYWEPGLTLAGFAQYALARTLEQFEQERGAPFPDRKTRQLRGGRPIK